MLGFGAKWCPGPDSWAIVTGSTDGIGLSYAKAMAKKGYCLLLISRNQQKLEKVQVNILNDFPQCPQVKILAVDFCSDTIYKRIAEEIYALNGHVHVLINNVGMAYKYPEYFTKILDSEKFISDILNCNILSVTKMTHICLPLMEARRSGIIINVASFSALFPTPLLTLYSASKIYMDYFSRALSAEYAKRGIIIQSVLPYYVSTNMIRNPGISLMVPSADQFVHAALKTVGVQTRTYGYFAHNILAFFQNFFGKFIVGNSLNTQIAFKKMKRFRKGCYKRKGLAHKF
ncbi:hydroxysteroid dehydrogenase-like protein 5 [Sarcoptes scabiei]|nr:hydroxysteroid dehydrogenase-like protein 5 [Sarcoptes scabiei]